MRIASNGFEHGKALDARFAVGTSEGFGGNRNPQLAWSDIPEGTRSFALLCVDPDVPTDPSLVGKAGIEIPVEHPRGEFIHWVVADIAPDTRAIEEGSCSDGFTRRGKPATPGPGGGRQGSNSYTQWFAGDADLRGDYFGYDGPYPPANDLRVHRYFFRVFALDVATLDLPEPFAAADMLRAMHGHVLAEALTYGTYALHPDVDA